ncbi:uncharacterized protein LOC110445855 isoform X2 [Mizuhopecten yessoensis]|uniref:uncharacterized protein LOC110445855 isoform X2 n=1 Tax=Mizuhopecten yessoensis TaxID=6573 RepID=UPI000B45DA55|nr:uncharacterized protein LOC110445855 isoform X2 [Mizuhopecten yessoensis]
MEGEGDGRFQTEDESESMEGADGGQSPTVLSDNKDDTTQGADGSTTPTPEEGNQINDEESIASTETTLTTKADREVQELMKSVIDNSETTSNEDQSSFTQDGSEATEIHIPELDISFDQSETGSVILGQNTDRSENGSVIRGGVEQSGNGSVIESADQSDSGSVIEIEGAFSQETNNIISNDNKLDSQEDKPETSSTNFVQQSEDNYKLSTSEQSGSSESDDIMPDEGQLIHREAASPVLITQPPNGTVSPVMQVKDGNVSPEQLIIEISEDGNVTPTFHGEEMSQDGTISDTQSKERSENRTPLDLQSQENIQDEQDVDHHSLTSVSDSQLEEYDSMSSFGQHMKQEEEDHQGQGNGDYSEGQSSDGNIQPNKTDSVTFTSKPIGDGYGADDVEVRGKEEMKEVLDDSGEEDSSQFAQLIVQHVLGHAVSSFNESDTSLHDDATEAGSSASMPTDGDVKPTINGKPAPPSNEATHTEVRANINEKSVSLDQGQSDGVRSLIDIQLDNSTNLEYSSGGSGIDLPKRSNITLDSEMENETFDISMVSCDSTQTDNPEGIVICGKGVQKYTVEDTMSDTDCGPQGLRKLAPLAAYPEFPENYGNYKVCRTVGPNEKECLILETGENITCKKNGKIPKKYPVEQFDRGNCEGFVSPPPNESQSPHNSQVSSPSSGSSSHKSFHIKKSPEKANVPLKTSMPREGEEVNRHPVGNGSVNPALYSVNGGCPPGLSSQQNGNPMIPMSENNFHDGGHDGYNGHLTSDVYRDQYKNQVTDDRVNKVSDSGLPVDQGDGRQYNSYGPVSQAVNSDVSSHTGYQGDSAQRQPQLLNSEIFQDPISVRLTQNSNGRERIDHRILQSSSLYAPGSGLSLSHSSQVQGQRGHPSRSLNDMGTDRQPATSQFRHQAPLQSELSEQDGSTQNRGPLITEKDLQRYNVNFTDPGAYQRYQQILARENSTGETYAKFPSVPYRGQTQTVSNEPPMELVDSIYNRVLRNENPSDCLRNQLPQGAFEGSYLDTRNDPDASTDLTENEKSLLARIYEEYGATHLSAGIPQWSSSLASGQSVLSNDGTISTLSSGPVPSFKTLQEQQTSWMQMFTTLEEKHEQEMKHQHRQHKETIFEMQQRMENELFDQQQQLRRKLKVHKEALENSSSLNSTAELQAPDTYSEVSQRSSDRSPYMSPRQQQDYNSPRQSQNQGSTRHPREHSPSWREIYQEVRREMDIPPPVRRSLEGDFSLTAKQSPAQRAHSSPPTLTTPPRSRSPERSRSPRPKSPPRSRLQRSKSPPMSRSSRARSPSRSRSPPRSRSPKARSPPRSRSPPRVRSRSPPLSRPYLERMAVDPGEVPPRAGVYSSPMPIRRGKGSQSKLSSSAKPTTPPRNKEIYPLIVSPSLSEKRQSSVLHRELEDRHRQRVEQQESFDTELYSSATLSDDVHLSSSTRVGLREKHAKHMADLREYYEKELQGLRQALKASDNDTVSGHESLQHFVSENEKLQREFRLQREKIIDLEDKLDISNRRNYEIEQKVQALETRAIEYADYYKEAQDKISTFRSTVEELQFRSGEKDDLLEQLRAENNAHKNNLKKAKKIQEDQATYIHRDRTALEKVVEQYQANERERAILKESVNDLENKMYDVRTENVEMKRTITKLELENKRLSRENDNLHHKITQGISHNISGSIYNSLHESLGVQQEALALDHRRPSPSPSRPQPASNPVPTKPQFDNNCAPSNPQTDRYHGTSRLQPQSEGHTPSRPQPRSTPYVDNDRMNGSLHQSPPQEDSSVLNGSFHRTEDTLPMRTPPRNKRSPPEKDNNVSSPIMRAEEELYRLRDVLRNSPTTSREPAQPKIQKKKFYGSDMVTPSRQTDMSPDRHSDNMKLKKKSTSSSPLVKSSKSSKLESANSKSKSSSRRTTQTSAKGQNGKEDFSSQTRFDVNSENKMSRSPGDGLPQPSGVVWTNKKPPGGGNSSIPRGEDRRKNKEAVVPSEPSMTVDEMLDRVRAGDYLSRPDWEDTYTSMASKPKAAPPSPRQPTSREDRIKERLRSIGDMEHRYDDLNSQKRQLESSLSRLPSQGKSRKKREDLEDNLDRVERELGSVRMSLKRYNVLKSSI